MVCPFHSAALTPTRWLASKCQQHTQNHTRLGLSETCVHTVHVDAINPTGSDALTCVFTCVWTPPLSVQWKQNEFFQSFLSVGVLLLCSGLLFLGFRKLQLAYFWSLLCCCPKNQTSEVKKLLSCSLLWFISQLQLWESHVFISGSWVFTLSCFVIWW